MIALLPALRLVSGDLKFQHDIPTGPVMLIPGFASSQLHACRLKEGTDVGG